MVVETNHCSIPSLLAPKIRSTPHGSHRSLPFPHSHSSPPARCAHAHRDSQVRQPGIDQFRLGFSTYRRSIEARGTLLPASGYVSGFLFLLDTALISSECRACCLSLFGSLGCRVAAGPRSAVGQRVSEAGRWEPYASGPGFAEGSASVQGRNGGCRAGSARTPNLRASSMGRIGAGITWLLCWASGWGVGRMCLCLEGWEAPAYGVKDN